ncbi:MAG: MBL fold metallo-hydrolase [Gammaproteobacteria bacterium]|nr:MBL fold metallo-hydrolase [Gammaproteobacteria bacterium]MDH5310280.1 MBL fold metallo-hydrolase [Gammaproteobacteria bacterium]
MLLPRAEGDVYGFQAETLAPGVYALNEGNDFHIQPRGNVEVIEQSNGVVLVDGGGSPAGAEQVIGFVRSKTPKPVTAIVITHWHGDHALGVSRLLQEWPDARVISTGPTSDMLTSPEADRYMPGDDAEKNAAYMANIQGGVAFLKGASQDEQYSEAERAGFAQSAVEYEQFAREMATARRAAPTETFEHSLTLADQTHPVEVTFLGRANTAGDAVVWLPRQKVVITGDLVVAPVPFGFNSYPEEWIGVLDQVRGLNYAVLAPGHGRPMRDTAYVDLLISMVTDVRAQVAPLASTDMGAAAVNAAVELDEAQATIAGDDPWLRRWFRDYWKEPIVSSALREARGVPIVQGSN